MTEQQVSEMLREHIPYRLNHLDGLIWALGQLSLIDQPAAVAIQLGDRTAQLMPLRQLTNPLVEVGILYCRVLLEFMGVRLNAQRTGVDTIQVRSSGDDFGIEDLGRGLKRITRDQIRGAQSEARANGDEIEDAVTKTLISAHKGIAHFTSGPAGRAYLTPSLVCAQVVAWCVEEYVYRIRNEQPPPYKIWTAPDR